VEPADTVLWYVEEVELTRVARDLEGLMGPRVTVMEGVTKEAPE